MKSQQGMALIMVLSFLNILTLLSLYSIQNNQSQYRMSAAYNQKQVLLTQADQVLSQIEVDAQTYLPNCVIPIAAQADFLKASLS